jgi:hypothetical protein
MSAPDDGDLPPISYVPKAEKSGRAIVKRGSKAIGIVRRRGHLWDVIEPAMPYSTGFTSRSAAGDALVRYYERQQREAPR